MLPANVGDPVTVTGLGTWQSNQFIDVVNITVTFLRQTCHLFGDERQKIIIFGEFAMELRPRLLLEYCYNIFKAYEHPCYEVFSLRILVR